MADTEKRAFGKRYRFFIGFDLIEIKKIAAVPISRAYILF